MKTINILTILYLIKFENELGK